MVDLREEPVGDLRDHAAISGEFEAQSTYDVIRVSAFSGAQRVGGVITAVAAPGLVRWESALSVAILWDLRVAPAYRRQSVATGLLRAAQVWADQQACTELKVETQNTNPAACSFYMRSGFALHEAHVGAYARLPDEVQLIWRKRLHG